MFCGDRFGQWRFGGSTTELQGLPDHGRQFLHEFCGGVEERCVVAASKLFSRDGARECTERGWSRSSWAAAQLVGRPGSDAASRAPEHLHKKPERSQFDVGPRCSGTTFTCAIILDLLHRVVGLPCRLGDKVIHPSSVKLSRGGGTQLLTLASFSPRESLHRR